MSSARASRIKFWLERHRPEHGAGWGGRLRGDDPEHWRRRDAAALLSNRRSSSHEENCHCQRCYSWSVHVGRLGREAPCEEASRGSTAMSAPAPMMPFYTASSADKQLYAKNKHDSGVK